jgi:hypothetical protein
MQQQFSMAAQPMQNQHMMYGGWPAVMFQPPSAAQQVLDSSRQAARPPPPRPPPRAVSRARALSDEDVTHVSRHAILFLAHRCLPGQRRWDISGGYPRRVQVICFHPRGRAGLPQFPLEWLERGARFIVTCQCLRIKGTYSTYWNTLGTHQEHIRNICLGIKASIQRIYPYS